MKAAAFRIGMSRLLPASLWALGTATLLLRAFLGVYRHLLHNSGRGGGPDGLGQ